MRPWLLALVLMIAAHPCLAQAPITADAPMAALAASVDQAGVEVADVGSNLRASRMSDAEIKRRMDLVPVIRGKLTEATPILTQRLADVDARLAQLGPRPAASQPAEAPETSAERQSLARQRMGVDTELRQARLLAVEATQIDRALAERLRANFKRRLWARSHSILDPGLWTEFAHDAAEPSRGVLGAVDAERSLLQAKARKPGVAWLWTLAALASLILLGPARIAAAWIGHRRFAALAAPGQLARTTLSLWLVLTGALAPLAAAELMRLTLAVTGALTPTFAELALLFTKVLFFAALVESLGRTLLAPGRPQCRHAPIPDAMVARLAPFPLLIALAGGFGVLVTGVNGILATRLATSVATDCIAVIGEMLAVGGALAALARARHSHLTSAGEPAAAVRKGAGGAWVLAVGAAWLALAVSVAAILGGYLALAIFVMRETLWIGMVLASLSLLLAFVDEFFPTLLAPGRPLGRVLCSSLGLSVSALEHSAVLISGLARLMLLLVGWSLILAPFGASVTDILSRITSPTVAFHIGAVPVSPGSILGALALFFLGLLITRAVRGWMESRWLPKTGMDIGVRTSVAAAVGYVGAAIAILLAFAYLGLSFSQIALFASALSVGIGFGLQAIIGNFVSGLILLAERPVKIGDWIAIGDLQGDVKRINIRATEIQMFDRSHLIVPNSDLISKTVKNFTHSGAVGRVMIVLKTQNDVDPVLVRDTLMRLAGDHPDTLGDPGPGVFLSDVRDGAFEFTIYAYVPTPRMAYGVKSQLLFQIVSELKAQGVSLYSSGTTVNVGLPETLAEPLPTRTGKRAAATKA